MLLTSLSGSGEFYKASNFKKSKYDGVLNLMAENPKRGFTVSSICEKFNLSGSGVRNFLGKGKGSGLHRVGYAWFTDNKSNSQYKVLVFQHASGGGEHLSRDDARKKRFEGKLFKG